MRGKAVEGLAVPVELVRPCGGEFRQSDGRFAGVADGFVVHVRQVADMRGGRSSQFHNAAEHILHDEGAEIADVGGSVHRGTAAVKAQRFSIHWGNLLCLPGAGIVKV